MNVILSVYSENAFKEYQLPSVNNADYSFMLQKEFFCLKKSINIKLEIMDGKWRFKTDKAYALRINGERYQRQDLKDMDKINVLAEGEKDITIIVKYTESIFHAYEKYDLRNVSTVTIGKDVQNDIVYDYLRLVSRKHAVISRTGKGFKIANDSLNGTYVNLHKISGEHMLVFGDYINIMGLKMVFLGDYLAIDTKGSQASINENKLKKLRLEIKDTEITKDDINYSKGKKIYHRAPRTIEELKQETITIEAPPPLNPPQRQPLILSIGPALTMALPMIMGSILMMYSQGSSGRSLYMYSGLIMSVSSAFIGVFWSLANIRYQKKAEAEKKQQRYDAYSAYLVEKTAEIKEKYQKTTDTLFEMYPAATECLGYDENTSVLWNRNSTHKDFLKHRLGIGNISFQIEMDVPKKKFVLMKDELEEKPRFIKEQYDELYDVPVTLDVTKNNLIGIVGGPEKAGAIEIAKVISAQIAANNCYTDVKMGFVYNGEEVRERKKWKFAKWLPHVWAEDKKTRYVADNRQQASEVFYELTKIFRNRTDEQTEKSAKEEELPKPYYVLFVSASELLEGELITKYIFEKENICGLTTFLLTERYEELPNACDFIIENTTEYQGMYNVGGHISERQKISFDVVDDKSIENFARHLSNLQVKEIEMGGEIPNTLTFFDMLEVSRPQEIPVRELWAKNRTYDNIKGLVGHKSGGAPCYLDVHEKYHGPHGLVAGTTGSGKSETLQTYMLALAVNYSPDDIGFFIIDYKGGGMANLFSGLPHMVGQISNLSGNQVKRAMISIKSENRRRQRVFTEHGVNNINLYTKLYKNGEATMPVPHLFIIIDEFAELKREEPDFMKELISVAQVGRSLGVHLILATQKPSGTVDDNIWSNSKFRLCLRVQDKQDSTDMLHKPDAAYITQAGRCYLQVGNDEVYELFQSGYSGATYEENVNVGNTEIAKLLNLNGKVEMTGNSVKISQKKKTEYMWIEVLRDSLLNALTQRGEVLDKCIVSQEKMKEVVSLLYADLEKRNIEYAVSQYNTDRLFDFINLYYTVECAKQPGMDVIDEVLEQAAANKVKLPQKKEKTQLDAVKEHLAVVARECGYNYHMQLWMPVLEEKIYLNEFQEYTQHSYYNGGWMQQQERWSLEIVLGKVDDPANQNQMPLLMDFAKTGHMAVFGSIVSGKSTLLQTMVYALIKRYSPETVNIYALDFSSKMMSAFEDAPHVGGVMYEGDLDKISKFFNMINSILGERKTLFRGGNYSQYVQLHGVVLPAIIILIDNYASFKEKTSEAYEEMMIRLSKEGVSHGIFLVVSGGGIGMNDITSRVCENITESICLQLQDRYAYIDLLHSNQIDVLPESGVKGRGLVCVEDRILEFHAALAVDADNDYSRIESIRRECEEMRNAWPKKKARRIPEIPEKPVWSEFHELDEYQKMLPDVSKLPVAYDASNAAVYSIDLSAVYCYLIYGSSRSGKTNFLKVCIQAALEKNANVCIIDNPARDLKVYENANVTYAMNEESIFAYFSELLPEFKRRNQIKNLMLNEEKEEEEIFEVMSKEIPYFIFIADLAWFVPFIYEAKLDMRGFLNN
ncbi:MAG: type VII secretion protein EssC, partial [Lachnospiraceae bacterium]|nr:type VII secretion protein EssC [Lachnospiraceae bacterium]